MPHKDKQQQRQARCKRCAHRNQAFFRLAGLLWQRGKLDQLGIGQAFKLRFQLTDLDLGCTGSAQQICITTRNFTASASAVFLQLLQQRSGRLLCILEA